MVHKIAYALAFGSQGGSLGPAVNIKIADISFQEIESITNLLERLAGRSGTVYERNYDKKLLELDMVSDRNAKTIASYLSKNGVEIESFTSHTIRGRMIH
jgi:transcriptional regulator CtsR